jgi:hypothetical protein
MNVLYQKKRRDKAIDEWTACSLCPWWAHSGTATLMAMSEVARLPRMIKLFSTITQ